MPVIYLGLVHRHVSQARSHVQYVVSSPPSTLSSASRFLAHCFRYVVVTWIVFLSAVSFLPTILLSTTASATRRTYKCIPTISITIKRCVTLQICNLSLRKRTPRYPRRPSQAPLAAPASIQKSQNNKSHTLHAKPTSQRQRPSTHQQVWDQPMLVLSI